MQVSFNPAISFRQQTPTGTTAPAVSAPVKSTPADLTPEQPKKEFREGAGGFFKFFANLSEMTQAAIKAVGYGLLTGATVTAGFWTFGTFPRSFQKGNSVLDCIKHPIRNMSTKGKVISAASMLLIGAYHLIRGKLKANQRTADIDHQFKIGHRAS